MQYLQVRLNGDGEVECLVQEWRQRLVARLAGGFAPIALPLVLHAERAGDIGVVSVGQWMGGAVVQLE